MKVLWRQLPAHSPLSLRAGWRAAAEVLRPGRDPRAALRERIRKEYGAEGVLLTGSGTAALQLGLRAGMPDSTAPPVIALPAFTCFNVAAAAVALAAPLALYDVDPSSLAPDLDSLERLLRHGAAVVVVTPLYGIPVDWDAVEECASRYGAVVIEDAAQGHGATWRGSPLGALGRLSVLSFGRGKGWTGGRGGALLLRGYSIPAFADGMAMRRSWLSTDLSVWFAAVAQCALGRPDVYRLPASIPWLGLGETRYRDAALPAEMSRVAARLLLESWEPSAHEAARRRVTAWALLQSVSRVPHVFPIRPHDEGTPGFLRLPLRLSRGLGGFTAPGEALRLGVSPGYPSTLAELPKVRPRLINRQDRWPGAEDLVRQLVTLPTHSLVTLREWQALTRLLGRYPN